jgi:uncharacterized membrane protein
MHKVKAVARTIWDKVTREPVAVRAAVLSVINIAVLTGLVGPSFVSEEAQPIIDAVFLAITNISVVLSARARVSPAPRTA